MEKVTCRDRRADANLRVVLPPVLPELAEALGYRGPLGFVGVVWTPARDEEDPS
jgi:hypothetical protein